MWFLAVVGIIVLLTMLTLVRTPDSVSPSTLPSPSRLLELIPQELIPHSPAPSSTLQHVRSVDSVTSRTPSPSPTLAMRAAEPTGRFAVLFTGRSLHSNEEILRDIYAHVVAANNADAYFVMDLEVPEYEILVRKIFGDRVRLIRYTHADPEYTALENDFGTRRQSMIPKLIETYGQENFENTAGYMTLDFCKSNSQFSRLAYGCKLMQQSRGDTPYDAGIRWRIDMRPLTPFVFSKNLTYFTRRDAQSVHDFYWSAPWSVFTLISTEFGKRFMSFLPQPWFRDMACPEIQLHAFLCDNGFEYEHTDVRFGLVENPGEQRYWTAERST